MTDLPEIVLVPRSGLRAPSLREVIDHGDLLFILAWRDISVRYRQTFFGVAWAILPSLMTLVVFTIVFGHVLGLNSYGVPYWAFSITALVPWTYFAQAVTAASNSVINNATLVEKIYFPRVLLPAAAVLGQMLDLAIAIAVMIVALLIGGMLPGPWLLLIVPAIAIAVIAALGVGLGLAAINVIFRDVRHLVPLLVQLWLFATPVVYALDSVPQPFRLLLALNPMTGVVEGFRWAFLGAASGDLLVLGMSALSAIVMLVVGAMVFGTLDRRFADVI